MFRDLVLNIIKVNINPYEDEYNRMYSKQFQISNEENTGYESMLSKMQVAQNKEKNFFENKCNNQNCNFKFDYFKKEGNEPCNFCSKVFCTNCNVYCDYCSKLFCKYCVKLIYSENKDINCCPNCG